MKNKKTLKESIGRDLVGASKFASKSNVTHQILLKYPTPDKLAASLKEMASNAKDAKVKAKCEELAKKCSTVDVQQYPKFVGDIAGLSRFWTIAGATIGAAGLTAATTYLVKAMSQAAQDDSFKNAKGFKDSTKALMSKTGDVISQDYDNAKKAITNTKDDVVKGIRDWAGRQIEKSDSGQNLKHEVNRNRSDIDQNKQDITSNSEAIAANKAAQDAGFKNAAEKRAEIVATVDADRANAAAARAELKATQDTDRADAIRRWREEQAARQSDDYNLSRRLNGKVTIGAKSPDVTKPAIKAAAKTLADPEMYKDAYGPYIDKAKSATDSSVKAVGNFLNKYGDILNHTGYHGMY